MDDATQSLPQPTPWRPPIVDQRQFMLHVSALFAAREQVKLRLKQEGFIVSQYKSSQITEFAKQLLDANRPRMLAEAKARIMGSPRLRADWEAYGRKYEAALAKRQAALAKRNSKQQKKADIQYISPWDPSTA
jgi:hypothetical protein